MTIIPQRYFNLGGNLKIFVMIISPLYNDVLKKKEFWLSFSKDNSCKTVHYVTKSRDANRLTLEYIHNDIKVLFEESDGKPLICKFTIKLKKEIILEISKKSLIDKLFRSKNNEHLFLKRYIIKSNCSKVKSSIINDKDLLNLFVSSEFYGLYGYSKNKDLIVRITSSFFVDNYNKLKVIYLITNSLIDKIVNING